MDKKKEQIIVEIINKGDKYDQIIIEPITSEQLFIENTYKQYKGYLFYIINNSLINKQEKEEILQDVFVVALSNYDKIKSYENIKSWLGVTAVNLVNNANRKYLKQQRQFDNNLEHWNELAAKIDIYEDIRYRDFLRENIFAWLFGRLSKEEIGLYKMKYIQNRTLEEIATHFNISKKCASTRIWRLRQKVEKCIGEFSSEIGV